MDTDLVILSILLFFAGVVVGYLALMLRLRLGFIPTFILHSLFSDVPYAVLLQDRQMRYRYVNPAFAQRASPLAQHPIGKSPKDIFPADLLAPVLEGCESALAGQVYEEPLTPNYDGDKILSWRKAMYMPRRDWRGNVVGILITVLNMDELYKLTETSQRQALMLASVSDAIIVTDMNSYITDWNRGAEALYGYSAAEAHGQRLMELLGSALNAEQRQDSRMAVIENGVWRGQDTHRGKSSEDLIVDSTVYILRDAHHTQIGLMGINHDITEQKRVEEALRKSEAAFFALVEAVPISIVIYRGAQIIYTNPAGQQLSGYRLDELQKMDALQPIHPDSREFVRQNIVARERGEPALTRYEYKALTKQGETRWVDTQVAHIDFKGKSSVLITAVDITERKQAEEALHKSETRFRTLIETIPYSLAIYRDGEILYSNPASEELSGYSQDDFQTMNFLEAIHPDSRDLVANYVMARVQGEAVPSHYEYKALTKHGEMYWVDVVITIIDFEDKPSVMITAVDITERKRIEEALRESEVRFRNLIETIPVNLIIYRDNQVRYVNPTYERMSGYTLDEFQKMDFLDIVHPDSRELTIKYTAARARGEDTPRQYESKILSKHGKAYWIELIITHTIFEGQPSIMVTGFDITERKYAEESLRESEERFRQLAENTHEVFYVASGDGKQALYISPAYEQIWGRSCDSFYQAPRSLMEAIHPDDIARVLSVGLQHRQIGTTLEEEYRIIRPDGATRWIWAHSFFLYNEQGEPYRLIGSAQDITERKQIEQALRKSEARSRTLLNALPDLMFELDSEGHYLSYNAPPDMPTFVPPDQFIGHTTAEFMPAEVAHIATQARQRALETGTLQTYEYELLNGEETHFYEGRVSPIPGEDRLLVLVRDITDRRRAEESLWQLNVALDQRVKDRTAQLQAANAELKQANERLKELDQLKTKFISDISHELRTPFANLSTYLYLLEHDKVEKRAHHLTVLKDEFARLTKLLESILDLSRLDPESNHIVASAVDLNSLIEQALPVYRQRAESNGLLLAFEPTPNLPPVYGDANHLSQVLTNLLTNAINYTPAGLVLVSTDVDHDSKQVGLMVRDTGFGIDPEDLPHLFERFYRGKNASQSTIPGTGLGLGIAQEIVSMYGGRIEVDSEVSKGSVFTIWLQPYHSGQ